MSDKTKGHPMKVLVITLCLMMSLVANTSHAQFKTVWADPKHDEKGDLLPLQSYGETINRGMKFILEDRASLGQRQQDHG